MDELVDDPIELWFAWIGGQSQNGKTGSLNDAALKSSECLLTSLLSASLPTSIVSSVV